MGTDAVTAAVALLAVTAAVAVVAGRGSPAAQPSQSDASAGCAAVAFRLHRIAGTETDEALLAALPRSALGVDLDERGSNVSHVVVDGSTATASCPAGSDLVVRFAWAWSAGLNGWGVGAATIDGIDADALEPAFFRDSELASAASQVRTAGAHRYHVRDGRAPTYTSGNTLFYVTKYSDVDGCWFSIPGCSPGFTMSPEGPPLWDAIIGQLP